MKAAACALLLLAAPLHALDPEAPGRPAQRARERIEAMPVEARVELRRLYFRYVDAVARRVEKGWKTGLLNEAVLAEHEAPFRPARLVEATVRARKREVADLEAAAEKDGPKAERAKKALPAKRRELARLRDENSREKGVCRDWSDLAWFELNALEPEYWEIEDRERGARPYHTAAVACAQAEQAPVCLAFDPWAEGKPEVYAHDAWDEREPGGRFPADFFIHGLPEKVPEEGRR